MKSLFNTLLVSLGIFTIVVMTGCTANTSDPALPATNDIAGAVEQLSTAGHSTLGVYDLVFDPGTMELSVLETRGLDAHYNITPFLAGHVTASIITWDPVTRILTGKLSITNPSVHDVFDVRTLFFADASSGWELLNPDDFTELFNPFTPGTVNPFRAYAKLPLNREFGAGATYDETFIFQCPPVFGPPAKLQVECSWPSNCEEAYEISNQTISNPISATTSGLIKLDAYDHQNNISAVRIDTTPITGGMTWLSNTGGTNWEANIVNSAGAAPGVYKCWIAAENLADPWHLYDYLDIDVVPVGTTADWDSNDHNIPSGGCSYDLGVVADPGGPMDSNILMVDQNSAICGTITKYDPYYTGSSNYVDLKDYDPGNLNYQPYPVVRLDATNDGAFSFTNKGDLPYPIIDGCTFNYHVWSVFDNSPLLHLGPPPDEGRYYFDTMSEYDAETKPIDVCDDFTLGQYALFSTGVLYTPRDLLLMGTMPDSYTYDKVKYFGNLDLYAGTGCGFVNPDSIYGIDVIEYLDDSGEENHAKVYILEESSGNYQVEVFSIYDTAPAWGEDSVNWDTLIDVAIPGTPLDIFKGVDIELLPVNSDYELNTVHPTLCVLVTFFNSGDLHGEVFLYDAVTGVLLETIGDIVDPSMPKSTVFFLDTDDDNWEIHVTRENEDGDILATVFTYS